MTQRRCSRTECIAIASWGFGRFYALRAITESWAPIWLPRHRCDRATRPIFQEPGQKAWDTKRPPSLFASTSLVPGTRHLVVPNLDILSPFCVRAKFKKRGISFFRGLNAASDRQLLTTVNNLKPLIQKHFDQRIVAPDEEPAYAGIEFWVSKATR
jgi:hypothetical protein